MLQTGQPTGACDCQFASSALCSPRGSPQRRTNGNCEQRSAKKVVLASVLPTLAAFFAQGSGTLRGYNSSSARSRLLRAASVTAVTFARLLRARHSTEFMPKLLHAIILGLASVRSLSTTRRRIIIAPVATALPVVALPALAEDDETARAAALQAKLAERRKLMELSRSSNDRQRYFDLSRQRASVVYNTTYRGASCVPGLPCI